MDLFEAIQTRRSIRKYADKPVEDEKLEAVLEAVRLAPSWANMQCWRMVVVRDAKVKETLSDLSYVESYFSPKGFKTNPSRKALAEAPMVIVLCAEPQQSGAIWARTTTSWAGQGLNRAPTSRKGRSSVRRSRPWRPWWTTAAPPWGASRTQQFRVLFLNSQNEIIAEEIIQEGTVNQTVVYTRKVLELALKHKATGLNLVHNHPSGNPAPSAADREITQTLVKASHALNLTVHDHLIISRHGYFSLAEHNML